MVADINLSGLRNTEYLRFMADALDILRSFPANALQCDTEIGTLSILVAELQILHRSDPASVKGGELAGMDAARDRLITGLVKYCDAHTYGPDPDKRAAADVLCRSLAGYGADIAHQSYQSESAAITNILAEWNTRPELLAAAARIDANEWMSALHEVNERFKNLYQHRSRPVDGVVPTDTLLDKRAETDEAWFKLRDHLDHSFTIHEGSTPWSTAIARLNALIGRYQNMPGSRLVRTSPTWPQNQGISGSTSENANSH